jgi:hypothetical protein
MTIVHVHAVAVIASVPGSVLADVEVKSNLDLILGSVCPLRDRLMPGLMSLVLACPSFQVRKGMVKGLSKDDSKALRRKFIPDFDNFDLVCPKLDETMIHYWKQAYGKDWRANLNDLQEKSWQSIQFQMLDVLSPFATRVEPITSRAFLAQ